MKRRIIKAQDLVRAEARAFGCPVCGMRVVLEHAVARAPLCCGEYMAPINPQPELPS